MRVSRFETLHRVLVAFQLRDPLSTGLCTGGPELVHQAVQSVPPSVGGVCGGAKQRARVPGRRHREPADGGIGESRGDVAGLPALPGCRCV